MFHVRVNFLRFSIQIYKRINLIPDLKIASEFINVFACASILNLLYNPVQEFESYSHQVYTCGTHPNRYQSPKF